jgi:hypothetical protein
MGHTVRGAVSAWLALIVLQTVMTKGSDQVAGALAGINGLVQRALSPNVPAIPDRRAGAGAAASRVPYGPNMTKEQLDALVRAAGVAPAVGQAFGPGSSWAQMPDFGALAETGVGQVDWSAVARNLPH